ncbi:TetR/AcrR family transcriptional regulator [Bacillus kwashiorkori]|uniref:TetR/AcrR family transcriptional regulator n=1 Tax=Bacillus kwashiorkori TaxID=1522318 RepID=UPI001EF0F8D2|nr:TetR/AcrR family transcriptional regulator [Bacillus kwashiorkori]
MKPRQRYDLERKKMKEERLNSILDAASRLFAEKGIENTTMQDIADAANLGVATVFRFFSKKEKIIVAVATRKVNSILHAFEEAAALKVPCIQKIEWILDSFFQSLRIENNYTTRILEDFDTYVSRIQSPIEDIEEFNAAYRKVSKVFSSIVEEGIKDGSIRADINIRDTLTTLMNAFGLFTRKLAIHRSILWLELDLEPEKQLSLFKKIVLDYLQDCRA